MSQDNININVQETNDIVNIVSSEVTEVIDINVGETIEEVTLNITEEIIQVNINKITGGGGDQTLAQTLVFGNQTDGTDIFLNNEDSLLLENTSSLKKGTYNFGGNGGISRICSNNYEDMWQNGFRHVFDQSGFIRNSTNCFDAVPDSSFDVTLRFKIGSIWTLDDGTNYICTDATEGAAVWELYNVIPTNTSDLNNDSNFVSDASYVHTDNNFTTAEQTKLAGIEAGAEVNVNADWNATSGDAQILNKPTIPSLTGFVPYTGATTNVNLGEYEIKAGQITFDTSPTGTAAVATTRWNDTIGSAETTLKGGSVVLKNGVDLVARVVNKVSPNTTLTKAAYQVVRVTGAQGQRLAVDLAQANNDNNSADTLGVVTETIATNQEGFILTVGQIENINTTGSLQGETWADGDVLYLSPTTAGKMTNIKPTGATGHIVILGYVEYAHSNHGKIYVKIMNGWELDELHNVSITSVANYDGIFYNSATSLWENKNVRQVLPERRNANKSDNNNINYCGTANKGSAEASAVWTIKRLTIGSSGSITIATATNVAWTNRESATYI
jgi:nitrogen fixation protein